MGFLDQIKKGITVTATPEQTTAPRATKERNPVTSELRLYANGAIYPSAKLVKDFKLEYHAKNDPKQGQGFDVILSSQFSNLATSTTPFLMIAPVAKDLPKVDFFDQCRYNADETPMTSVMEQGSKNFGPTLWKMLQEAYGVTPETAGEYIDLDIVADIELQTMLDAATNGIYNIPKTVSRGAKAGTQSYIRRENLDIFVLIPHTLNTSGADVITGTEEQVGKTVKETV